MFKKATKEDAYLRLAVFGASGSGKTKFALGLGQLLGKMAVIDTEHGSASKYADGFQFDTCQLDNFSPTDYTKAIAQAKEYKVLVIDSLSHAWSGKGGALELAEKHAVAGNTFAGWKTVTPMHNEMIEAIVSFPGHVIVTMRSKTDYAMESYQDKNGNTKMRPTKLGLAPVQRDSTEYEFDITARLEMDHTLSILKSRCESLDSKVLPAEKSVELCYQELKHWLGNTPVVQQKQTLPSPQESTTDGVTQEDWDNLYEIAKTNNWPEGYVKQYLSDRKKKGVEHVIIYDNAMTKFSEKNEKAEV